MQPIFNEMINMWKDFGLTYDIQEGYFWFENGIIKGVDSVTGNIKNIYKVTIDDDLNISFKEHADNKRNKNKTFENWNDTIIRYKERLDKLEYNSIKLLKQYGLNTDKTIIDTNSTGKDSEVKTYLAKKAGLSFKTYFNVTTMDPAETIIYAKQKGYIFTYPNIKKFGGFYQWIKKENLIPTRLNRGCCTIYKEGATKDFFNGQSNLLFLFGMRNSESSARSGYTDVWYNDKWGIQDNWSSILPIREWEDIDIWLYTFREHLDFNIKYRMGYPRVGCQTCCPNATKPIWFLDKYWYNKSFNRWRKILEEDFIKNNKWIIMNCTIYEYVNICWCGGIYRKEPTQEVVEEFSKYSGIDIEIASGYFNKYCCNGCINKLREPLKIKDKDVIGMNMKMYGRNIQKFKCKRCLMKDLELTKEQFQTKVNEFKDGKCALF